MALGYSDQGRRRLIAATTLDQYDVVKQHTVAGQVAQCGTGEKAVGITTEAAVPGDAIDVVLEGDYFAVASEVIAVGATLSPAATGGVKTAITTDAHTLGDMGPAQAAAVTNDLVAVHINKQVVSNA